MLRSPAGDGFATREWVVVDQKLPVPFPISEAEVAAANWIPLADSLDGGFGNIRKHSSFRAFPDNGELDPGELAPNTRLVGRSVWNTQWVMVIPAGALLDDPDLGLDGFVNNVTDVDVLNFLFVGSTFSGSPVLGQYLPPRTWGLRFAVNFTSDLF